MLLGDTWLAVGGCSLHVHNLTLETSYLKVFGTSDLGMPSVLCLVRTISWLQTHFHDLEQELAVRMGIHDFPRRRICDAVLTRWHTFSKSLRWLRAHRATYARLCVEMCDGLDPCKTRDMYATVAKWLLEAPKLTTDTEFCNAFCSSIWDPRHSGVLNLT